jgi:nitrile hydratase subunit beta
LDGIHDMGGMQGFGAAIRPHPEPTFDEPWEGKAFALGLLSIRVSGTNLHAFRHAMNRVHPVDYLSGYYARWALGAQNLLTDSGIVSDAEVTARAARLSGQDAEEPPSPEPHKPEMASGGPGNLRSLETPPAFNVGDAVRTRDLHPSGHTRLPRYVRRRTGTVAAIVPAQVFPDSAAHFLGEDPQHVYSVEFDSAELWGPGAEPFSLTIDLFEPYLEPAT